MKVYIVGIGMGNPDTLTVGAKRAIESSGLLIGATRLLESFDYVACEKARSHQAERHHRCSLQCDL